MCSGICDHQNKWTYEKTCQLIDIYRETPRLWDPKHIDYKNKIKKNQALRKFALALDITSMQEVARKIKNINSQYLRELRKEQQRKMAGEKKRYRAKWFGYPRLGFLIAKYGSMKYFQTGKPSKSNEETDDSDEFVEEEMDPLQPNTELVKNEITDDYFRMDHNYLIEAPIYNPETNIVQDIECIRSLNGQTQAKDNSNNHEEEPNHDPLTILNRPTKVKENAETIIQNINNHQRSVNLSRQTQVKDDSEIMHKIQNNYESTYNHSVNETEDVFDVFGNLVARKLRNLCTHYAQCTVQNLIHNLLYEAEIGNYDEPKQNPKTHS